MASPKQPNVDLHTDAYEALKRLQSALQAEGVPVQARLQDIVSALVLYTPPQQAAGMLAAFSRHLANEVADKGETGRSG